MHDFFFYVTDAVAAFASIGNRVFYDTNGDGKQGRKEIGIPGVVVHLIDVDRNEVVGVDVTNARGFYLFSELNPYRTYTVEVEPPVNTIQTADKDGVLDAKTTQFLISGEDERRVDFGFHRK